MNRDRDVLFLFLTSHGSRDHRFSLSFWPLGLYDLTPPDLRALLDDAGVQNRVIVISACYSGGFVDALKDPHTLVITAAAADRTSFGCSNEADFTWFGRAYFDEALRKTRSFTDAFALAAPVVAERERHEGYDPSNPQMVEGSELLRPWRRCSERWTKRTGPARPPHVWRPGRRRRPQRPRSTRTSRERHCLVNGTHLPVNTSLAASTVRVSLASQDAAALSPRTSRPSRRAKSHHPRRVVMPFPGKILMFSAAEVHVLGTVEDQQVFLGGESAA